MAEPFFDIPLNLPHAATVAHRILHHMRGRGAPDEALVRAGGLILLLEPWRDREDNGPAEAAEKVRQSAAALGRVVVDDIEKSGVGYDRLGQAVRNLFECLAMGQEGARISLRAGESPNSMMRPV
jgi:hypothetical protein